MHGARRRAGPALALLVSAACGPALPALEVPGQPLVADLSTADFGYLLPLDIGLDREPEVTLQIHLQYSRNALFYFGYGERTTRTARVTFTIWTSGRSGVYEDTVIVQVCADDACQVQVPGSPATVRVHTTVHQALRQGEPVSPGVRADPRQ